MGKYNAKTVISGTDVDVRFDRFLLSDESQPDGSKDRNITPAILSLVVPRFEIVETSHGLSVGDLVRYNGSAYVAADATTTDNAAHNGLVVEVPDSDTLVVQQVGFVSELSGLTAGNLYYLQDGGGLGTSAGTVSKLVLRAVSATEGWLLT